MINPIALIQVKAFARIEGLWMALVWIVSMILTFKLPDSSWGPLMALSTPFFLGWRLKSFRDNILEGYISFRRALCFVCYIFFYGSLLFAVGQFLYLTFLDGGAFVAMLESNVKVMQKMYADSGISADDLDTAVTTIKLMSPIDISFLFLMYNILIGAVVSPLVALVYKKNKISSTK